jgi:AraC-like DNA-binding protein
MPFDFSLYSSLLLPAFIQGFLFTGLLFYRGWKEAKLSDKLLGFLLMLNAFKIAYWMLGFAGWYDTHDGYTSFMFYFPFDNVLWMGPLLYFYFLSLTNADFKFEKKHWKHFVLPAVWLLLILGKFIIDFAFHRPFPDTENTQYGTKGPFADLDKNKWAGLISYASFFYYLFITIRSFRSYQSYVKENFSATEEIRFDWLRNILYAISAGVIIIFLFNVIAQFKTFGNNSYIFDWYAYLFLGVITYYLSIAGYFAKPRLLQKLHFTEEEEPVLPEEETAIPEEDEMPELASWKEKLLAYMENKKPYLEPELSLSDLAKQLKTNTSVLSKVINDGTGRNFNDFINSYRVQEVITKLKAGEQQTQTLLGIAYDCGFNSKATFNRSFKKVNGKTPKEFMDSLSAS